MTIKRNKIALFIKASRGKGLESNLYKSFPDNFLTKQLKVIEKEWGFDLEEYMKKYKGKKLIPKEAPNPLLQSRIEVNLEECLNQSTFFPIVVLVIISAKAEVTHFAKAASLAKLSLAGRALGFVLQGAKRLT